MRYTGLDIREVGESRTADYFTYEILHVFTVIQLTVTHSSVNHNENMSYIPSENSCRTGFRNLSSEFYNQCQKSFIRLGSTVSQTPGALNLFQVGVCGTDFRSVGLVN